jgi:hypothetical protein
MRLERKEKMNKRNMINLTIFSFCFFLLLALNACIGSGTDFHVSLSNGKKVEKHGPPDHAKAYGRRAKYDYHYYPDAQVYFDTNRRVYFYLDGRGWKMSVNLPHKIKLAGYVTIEMDTDKPYKDFKRHKAKYPPGQMKKKKNKWSSKR